VCEPTSFYVNLYMGSNRGLDILCEVYDYLCTLARTLQPGYGLTTELIGAIYLARGIQ
jgi:hypothetical protein